MADHESRILFCILEHHDEYFQIKSKVDENVLDLKNRIRTANPVALSHVDAHDIPLYQASSLKG